MNRVILNCPIDVLEVGLINYEWKPRILQLFDDGMMIIYKSHKSYKYGLNLKKALPYLVFDDRLKKWHLAKLPRETNPELLVGFPKNASKTKTRYKWFSFQTYHHHDQFVSHLAKLSSDQDEPWMVLNRTDLPRPSIREPTKMTMPKFDLVASSYQ